MFQRTSHRRNNDRGNFPAHEARILPETEDAEKYARKSSRWLSAPRRCRYRTDQKTADTHYRGMVETRKGALVGGMGLRPMLRKRLCMYGLEARATSATPPVFFTAVCISP